MAADRLGADRSAIARIRTMGCSASVVVTGAGRGDDDLAALAHQGTERLRTLERRWSRFIPDSEITALNRADGCAVTVHPDTLRLVDALVGAWYLTGGSFDPTLLGALVGLGYAASRDDETRRTSLCERTRLSGRPDMIVVDHAAGTVRLPTGTALDPGGLGKGLAADMVVEELLDAGADGVLVEVGGDLRAAGDAPDGHAWSIAVAPVLDADTGRRLRLREGAAATSSSRLRTWRRSGRDHHHLLDPVTLVPTTGDTIAATVLTCSAADAEALTKMAFVAGFETALEHYIHLGVAASITTTHGDRHDSPAWQEFVA